MRTYLRKAFYSTIDAGHEFSRRIYLLNDKGEKISFWNDVPLKPEGSASDIFNCIIEIPRNTLAKLELARDMEHHPITHDLHKNRLNPDIIEPRYNAQFAFWNYGLIPQTWENCLKGHPKVPDVYVQGDNDPLDVLDISDFQQVPGSIIEVKILGGLALIDQGELDWKIISVNKKEADLKGIKNLNDLESCYPYRLADLKRWFTVNKTFDGKKENRFALDGKIFGPDLALEVIFENYEYWRELKTAKKTINQTQNQYLKKLYKISKDFHMQQVIVYKSCVPHYLTQNLLFGKILHIIPIVHMHKIFDQINCQKITHICPHSLRKNQKIQLEVLIPEFRIFYSNQVYFFFFKIIGITKILKSELLFSTSIFNISELQNSSNLMSNFPHVVEYLSWHYRTILDLEVYYSNNPDVYLAIVDFILYRFRIEALKKSWDELTTFLKKILVTKKGLVALYLNEKESIEGLINALNLGDEATNKNVKYILNFGCEIFQNYNPEKLIPNLLFLKNADSIKEIKRFSFRKLR